MKVDISRKSRHLNRAATFGDRRLRPMSPICKPCPAACPSFSSRESYAWRGTCKTMAKLTEDQKMARRRQVISTLNDRVKIDPVTGCHEWQGTIDSKGYGVVTIGRKSVKVHRLSYEAAHSREPVGAFVLHNCDNPCCINPDHLREGTHLDNMKDRSERDRTFKPRGSVHPRAKLTESQVLEIRRMVGSGMTLVAVSKLFPVHENTIGKIMNGTRWGHYRILEAPTPTGHAFDEPEPKAEP